MRDELKSVGQLGGRFLLSLIFLMSGTMKLMNWSGMEAYMAGHGMVAVPLLLAGAVLFEIGGGLSLLLGFRTRLGALALFLFLIPTTLIFHNFWAHQGEAMQDQMQHFLKNVTIMGGLLTVAAVGAGRYSLDTYLADKAILGRGWFGEPTAGPLAR